MSGPLIEFRSPDSDLVIVACRTCRMTSGTNRYRALHCCVCVRCRAPKSDRFGTVCEVCRPEVDAERTARHLSDELALPVVADPGGPVFTAGRYFEDAFAAAEAVWDDDEDPTEQVAHPCTVTPAPTPDLDEVVEEAWADCFEDSRPGLTPAMRLLLQSATRLAAAAAPDVWTPNIRVRIILPEVAE